MMKQGKLAVAYARVSSAEQEQSGYSIAAQRKLVTDYARHHGFTIVEWFVEARSGKLGAERKEFRRMCSYLAKHRTVRIALCEKTDRWARNLSDGEVVEKLELELHLVREHLVISPSSSTTQHLQHEIGLVIARNYLRNLRNEIVKGMTTKAASGLWPSAAPVGYKNHSGKERSLVPDPAMAPLVRALFRRMATGHVSGRTLTEWARAHGLTTRRGGELSKNGVLRILRNPLYIGKVVWKGRVSDGTHEPLVTVALFNAVQAVLGATASKARHAWTLNGLVRCGTCRGLLSSDAKVKRRDLPDGTTVERRYVYLHCGGKGGCKRTHYREEFFDETIAGLLRSLAIESATSAWLASELGRAHERELETLTLETEQLRQQKGRLERLQDNALEKQAEGLLTEPQWKRLNARYQAEIDAVDARLETCARMPVREEFLAAARRPIELLQRAADLWVTRDSPLKSEIMKTLFIELEVTDGSLRPVYRSPFGALAAGAASGNWWS
jgi:site-specific DNA recombinase